MRSRPSRWLSAATSDVHCRKCGHDLQGVTSDVCSECGTQFDRFFSESYVTEPVSGRPALRRSLVVLGCAVYVVAWSELLEIDLPRWLLAVLSILAAVCMVTGVALAIGVLQHGSRALRGKLPLHVHRGCTWAATAIAAGSVLLVLALMWW